jgi:uncharacterized protein (TIGR00288 family)
LEQNLCVLIDFENISAGCEKERLGRFDIQAVMNRLKDKGRILEARAYGDWGRYARQKGQLLEAGVQMQELPSYGGHDKNRADIALVVDAMDLVYTRDFIDTYVILSGDSDFTPLVMRLRSMNKRVVGIGTRSSTSRLLIAACDEFIFYESLKRRRPNKPEKTNQPEEARRTEATALTMTKAEAFEFLVETFEGLQKDDPQPVLAGIIKQSMQRKAPTFNEGDYGFNGFARFLEAARDKGLVGLARAERAGGYKVFEPGGTPNEEDASDEASSDGLPELTGPAAELRSLLDKMGVSPLTYMICHTVIHEFVDHITERAQRKRKNTLRYTVGDTARRCRKTDPPVATRHVRFVLNGLAQAGALLHADGNPVRSQSAPFTVSKDPEELLDMLVDFYLVTLRSTGVELDDPMAISWLLYGDDEHAELMTQRIANLPDPIEEEEASATEEASEDDPIEE